ncbi:MAG TPA: M24 family metallopeptidase [Bryobacteraceae bacterium]|nr:M24 family metallopeptidase [Bryobacteraceae bacterium]
MRIAEIQEALRAHGLDGWLFFDHHGRDPIAYRVLRFEPASMVTRRWYYLVPAEGDPVGLAHRIEPDMLAALPGEIIHYAGWKEQTAALARILEGRKRIAMQYSPNCAVPYVSNIDAGTVELVRAAGVEVVSSADLVQLFEVRWSDDAYRSHKEAGVLVDRVRRAAFEKVAAALASGVRVTEMEIHDFILDLFRARGLCTDHGPIVAVNANASNPHYEPTPERHSEIRRGDLLLIDLWAKFSRPGAAYYDITWTGYCGAAPPAPMLNVFRVVSGARDAAVTLVKKAADDGQELAGYEVDDAARGHIQAAGFGEYFFHRTGHSIGEEVHGNGANMDNYETHDERRVLARTCFSVEPGIYLPEFGIRSEVNVYRGESAAEVTGEIQTELLRLLQD